jgi:hypothetical protein
MRLWPDTAASVLGVDPVAVRDLTRPAAELLGFGALSLARSVARAQDEAELERVWETWLAPRIASAALPDPDVRFVVRRLIDSHGTCDVAGAARDAGISMRSLERRFSTAVGSRQSSSRACVACAPPSAPSRPASAGFRRSQTAGLEPRRSRASSARRRPRAAGADERARSARARDRPDSALPELAIAARV